ncbi:MAG: MFS transporter [Comamonadaceae bacterium]|nr:MAG: MFS transporter [Comamonadaceae bacterium]
MSTSEQSVRPTAREGHEAEIRRVVFSSYLGNTIEYYDFILYGSASALLFGPLFFSSLSASWAFAASFATLATGYVARPMGGVIFGFIGDRIGRKPILLATMLLMGLSSGLIGALPTYASAGVIAPILLVTLRVLQGFAVGGEWGGAALMIAEHAPPESRGRYAAIGQSGLASGGLLSTVALALVTQLPDSALYSWGWRLPFLASFALVLVGLYVRRRVGESPLFRELGEREDKIRNNKRIQMIRVRPLLRGFAITLPPLVASTIVGAFAVSYAVEAGFTPSTTLVALCAAWALSIISMPCYGRLSDRVGRRPVYITAALAFAALSYPFFWLIDTGSLPLLFAAFLVMFSLVTVAMTAVVGSLLVELFPTEARYTAVSVAYQGGAIVGGLAPIAATGLLALPVGVGGVSALLSGIALIALIAAWSSPESRGSTLRGEVGHSATGDRLS